MKKYMIVKYVDGSTQKISREWFDMWNSEKSNPALQFFNDGLINLSNVCMIRESKWYDFFK